MANETPDFLTALASRNGADAGASLPLLQPRLPSRFEPATPNAGGWFVESTDEAAISGAAQEASQPRAISPTNAPSQPTSPAQHIAPDQPASPQIQSSSMNPSLRVIERWMHERETQTIRVVERVQQTAPLSPATNALQEESAATTTQPATPVQPASPATPLQASRQPALEPKVPPALPKPLAATTEKQPEAAPQMPDVHITIGRIEVRANAAANKREPARRASSTPNLERYLNSLSGGSGGGNGGEG